MIGSDASRDILGVEVTPTVVRAIRLNRDNRKVIKAADCPVLTAGDPVALDPSAIGPALDEVLYQLGIDDRTEHLAAVSIGPRRAGVGSGPALPAWLEHRARQLGENMICAGKLGISFCPQRALDTAIMICEQANITVSRIDFAPVAAVRVLDPGTDTITLGSGRGWRARLRHDEILEALETPDVSVDDSLMIVGAEGISVSVDSLHGVSLTSDAKSSIGADAGCYAAAVGAALGVIDGSSGNLLDGDTVRGREVPPAFTAEVGGVNTGEIAGSRTTVSLARNFGESEARSVIRQVGTVVEAPGEAIDVNVVDGPEELGGVVDAVTVVDGASGVDAAGVVEDADADAKPELDLFGFGPDFAADQRVDGMAVTEPEPLADSADLLGDASAEFLADDDTINSRADGGAVGALAASEPAIGLDGPAFDGSDLDGSIDASSDFVLGGEQPESNSMFAFGLESEELGERQSDMEVHPDDPIRSFSPEPGAEASMDSRIRGRGLALVGAGLILFSLAIAIGILVTQG